MDSFVRWEAANFLSRPFAPMKTLDNWMRNNVCSAYCSCSCFRFHFETKSLIIKVTKNMNAIGSNDVRSGGGSEWNTEQRARTMEQNLIKRSNEWVLSAVVFLLNGLRLFSIMNSVVLAHRSTTHSTHWSWQWRCRCLCFVCTMLKWLWCST